MAGQALPQEPQFALAVESTHTSLHSTVPVAQLRLGAEPPLAVLFPEPPVAGVLPEPPVEGVLPEPPVSVAGLPDWPGLAALYEPHEAIVAPKPNASGPARATATKEENLSIASPVVGRPSGTRVGYPRWERGARHTFQSRSTQCSVSNIARAPVNANGKASVNSISICRARTCQHLLPQNEIMSMAHWNFGLEIAES